MLIKRGLLEEVKPFLKRKEYIAIVGPRQAGKTTFLEIIKEYLLKEEKVPQELITIISFEDRKLLRQFEDDPAAFMQSFFPAQTNKTIYIMLDEFQYAEEGGQKLKLIYDTVKNLKIILTGSSSLEIKAQVGKYMVGRVLTFHLHPLDFSEILQTKDIRFERIYRQEHGFLCSWLFENAGYNHKTGQDQFYEDMVKYFKQYCIWGGYPAVVLAPDDKQRYKLLGDIYNNYILKDIKGLLELATERNLFLLSQYLATQIGSITVYQNVGQAAGLDFRRLKKHMNILNETFICGELSPFFTNRQKELTKNPKIYFMDMGFRNYLIDNMNDIDKRPDSGAIVENVSYIRLKEMREETGKINFWRTKAGAEVDFVLKIKGGIVPLEVKFSQFETNKISRSLASFIDSFKPQRALVLTRNYWGKSKKDDTEILFAPVYYL